MVSRDHSSLPDIARDCRFVDSKGECLSYIDTVEWLYQVIHCVIIYPQLGNLVEIRSHFVIIKVSNRYACHINLIILIRLVSSLCLRVESEDHPL